MIETNRYASQNLTRTMLTPHARAHKWTPVTAQELERFLGLVLLPGIMYKKEESRITGEQNLLYKRLSLIRLCQEIGFN